MLNSNGLAIYGTERNSLEYIYKMGLLFFEVIGLSITASGFYKYRSDRSDEDIDFLEVSLVELESAIKSGNATSFRLYHESENGHLWDASFGYSTKDFGGFYHVDAQGVSSCFEVSRFIKYIEEFCASGSIDYAIYFSTKDVSEATYYAAGENLVRVYEFENPSLFNKETGGRFRGLERFRREKLRMVYSVNVINNYHLNLLVNEVSLRDWIQGNSLHGALKKLTDELWLWTVHDQSLELVNRQLGPEGALISWRNAHPNKKIRRIP